MSGSDRARGLRRARHRVAAAASGSAARAGCVADGASRDHRRPDRGAAGRRRRRSSRRSRPSGATVQYAVADVTDEEAIAAAVARRVGADRRARRRGRVRRAARRRSARSRRWTPTRGAAPSTSTSPGTMLTIKHAARPMAAAGRGSIVGISSIASARTHRWFGAYGAGQGRHRPRVPGRGGRARRERGAGELASSPASSTPTSSASSPPAARCSTTTSRTCRSPGSGRSRTSPRWPGSSSARSRPGSPARPSASTAATRSAAARLPLDPRALYGPEALRGIVDPSLTSPTGPRRHRLSGPDCRHGQAPRADAGVGPPSEFAGAPQPAISERVDRCSRIEPVTA